MDRPPKRKSMRDEINSASGACLPQPGTSRASTSRGNVYDELIADEEANATTFPKAKREKSDYEKKYKDYRDEEFHPTIKNSKGQSVRKDKANERVEKLARWRNDLEPWNFDRQWKGKMGAEKNKQIIRKDNESVRVTPRVAFKWWLGLQTEEQDRVNMKKEWDKLCEKDSEKQQFDTIVWCPVRKCYCHKVPKVETYIDTGVHVRDTLLSLPELMDNLVFVQQKKKDERRAAKESSNLVPHGLSEDEINEKYILPVDEFGCLPLDGDWYWNTWQTPKSAEEKQEIAKDLKKVADGLYKEKIMVPVRFKDNMYWVCIDVAFQMWLSKQTTEYSDRSKIEAEWERIRKPWIKGGISEIKWGYLTKGGKGYGKRLRINNNLTPLVTLLNDAFWKLTPSTNCGERTFNGILRPIKNEKAPKPLADLIDNPLAVFNKKDRQGLNALSSLKRQMANVSEPIEESDWKSTWIRTGAGDRTRQQAANVVFHQNEYKRLLGKRIAKPMSLLPTVMTHPHKKLMSRPASQIPLDQRNYKKSTHVYILMLIPKKMVGSQTVGETFEMVLRTGMRKQYKFYVGKRTLQGALQPHVYHKDSDRGSGVNKIIAKGKHDCFKVATIPCRDKEEQGKLEAFIYHYLLKAVKLNVVSLVNKATVWYHMTKNDIREAFWLAHYEVPLIFFTNEPANDQTNLFQLQFPCRKHDFILFLR